jgi:hypothetical protein
MKGMILLLHKAGESSLLIIFKKNSQIAEMVIGLERINGLFAYS